MGPQDDPRKWGLSLRSLGQMAVAGGDAASGGLIDNAWTLLGMPERAEAHRRYLREGIAEQPGRQFGAGVAGGLASTVVGGKALKGAGAAIEGYAARAFPLTGAGLPATDLYKAADVLLRAGKAIDDVPMLLRAAIMSGLQHEQLHGLRDTASEDAAPQQLLPAPIPVQPDAAPKRDYYQVGAPQPRQVANADATKATQLTHAGFFPARREEAVVSDTGPASGGRVDTTDYAALERAAREQFKGERTGEAAPEVGAVAAGLLGLRQGATLGFGDEIAGTIMQTTSIERERERMAGAREQHPVLYGGGQVAGAIGTGGAAGLGRMAARGGLRGMAAAGAIEGGVYGAGAAEGGVERLPSAVGGAALGAAAGGAAGLGVRAVRGVAARGRRGTVEALEGAEDVAVSRSERAARSHPRKVGANDQRLLDNAGFRILDEGDLASQQNLNDVLDATRRSVGGTGYIARGGIRAVTELVEEGAESVKYLTNSPTGARRIKAVFGADADEVTRILNGFVDGTATRERTLKILATAAAAATGGGIVFKLDEERRASEPKPAGLFSE